MSDHWSIESIEKEVNICRICAIHALIVDQFTLKAFKGWMTFKKAGVPVLSKRMS
jgi:hypothetical protein